MSVKLHVIPAKAGIQSVDPRLKRAGMTLRVRLLRRTNRSAPEVQAAVRRSNNRRRPYGLFAMIVDFKY